MLHADSSEQTEQLGEVLGRKLRGGEIIELISDLGGGKTTFTRGLVRGAGSTEHVASPTFTVSKVYKSVNFDIHHFDFYRLNEAGLIEHELRDLIGDAKAVIVVEWGDVVQHVLPESKITIEIIQTDTDGRDIYVMYPDSFDYLMEQS